jgi:anti-sigma B factor antagonist
MIPEIFDVRSQGVGTTGCLLTAVGDLDRDSSVLLRDAIDDTLAQGRVHIVVDLSAVVFCDSGGLRAFVDGHRRSIASGGWLRLAGARARVLEVLHATNLDGYLALYPAVQDALDDVH